MTDSRKICTKKVVSRGKYIDLQRKYEKSTIMEAKETTRQNPIRRLLEYKRAMRECIQRGADHQEMKQITKTYGFTLATPV